MFKKLATVVVCVLMALVMASCRQGDHGGARHSGKVPPPDDGRLIRVVGDGSGTPLEGAGQIPDASINGPGALMVRGDGDLLGYQGVDVSAFTLTPDGGVHDLTRRHGEDLDRLPTAAIEFDEGLLIFRPGRANDGRSKATVSKVNLATGEIEQFGKMLTEEDPGVATAILKLSSGLFVQWGDTWWHLNSDIDSAGESVRVAPPIDGVLASARTKNGILALTKNHLVTIDENLLAHQSYKISLPNVINGFVITSAVSDGADGLYVSAAGKTGTPTVNQGAVLHVTPQRVKVLALGKKPNSSDSRNCQDKNLEAMHSHLSGPSSLAVWKNRLMVADATCNSILELPLPTRG